MIRQVVSLSAGLGMRLRPYTDTMPKPMIPLLGKPMLEWNITRFKKYGAREFFINLHYLPDYIKNYFGDGSAFGVKMRYNFEPIPLGTAGGVKQFENLLDEEFFLMYGDILSLIDYEKMEAAWRAKPSGAIGMQTIKKTDDYGDADVAELDVAGKFIAIHPKPHTERYERTYRMRGTFILKREILSHIPPNEPYEIGKHLLPDIVRSGEAFYGYESDDYSKGIDTVEKWKEVEEHLKRNNISL